MSNVLITGITGFAGSHLAEYLMENTDYNIFGFKRPNSQMRNIHQFKDKLSLHNGDLLDQNSIVKVLQEVQPDYIFHLGAMSWVTPSWDMPSIYMQVNAVGTINLFEAMRIVENDARVLISCTPEEYGDVPLNLIPITEETRIHPINPYAASKAAQDMISIVYNESYNFKIIRTRAFNHEGPRRDILGANASFAYQIARIEQGIQPPVVKVGNLEAMRNFTDVREIVQAYHLAMEKGVPGELYLIGSDKVYTMEECLTTLLKLSHKKGIHYEVDPSLVRPTELRTFIGNYSKFNKLTGWESKIPFHDTMENVLNYWREFVSKGYY